MFVPSHRSLNNALDRKILSRRTSPILTRKQLSISIAAIFFGATSAALAQGVPTAPKAAEPEEEIVITGTLIRGVAPVGAPVISLGQKEIQESGLVGTTDLLRSLPEILNQGATDSYNSTTASVSTVNSSSSNGVNLRGLGTSSTLVLINGHRMAPAGINGQLFDVSTIPLFSVGRLEVVADGASATYGSDAVAGVVNVILRKNFDGAETQLLAGSANGMHNWTFSQVVGKTWGTGNITATYEHGLRTALLGKSRSRFYTSDLSPYGFPLANAAANSPLSTYPGNIRVTTGTISGVTCSAANPCFFAIPAGQNGANLTGANLPSTPGTAANNYAGANVRNVWSDQTILPKQERDTLILTAEQTINDRFSLFGEALYTKRDFYRAIPGSNTFLNIPNSNPYSPCNLAKVNRPTFCGPLATSTISVPYYFGNDVGVQSSTGFSKNTTGTAGVDMGLSNNWKGEFTTTYSRNTDTADGINQFNTFATNPDIMTGASFTTNFNPFIGDGSVSASNQALLSKLLAHRYTYTRYTLTNQALRFDGPIFDLPAGAVRAAVGIEYRADVFDRLVVTNGGSNSPSAAIETVSPLTKKRNISAYYAELYVPLLGGNGMPKLDLSLAGRSEKYSDFGKTSNPKVGLDLTVMEELKLHASYGTSFRAPALPELEPTLGPGTNFSQIPYIPGSTVTGTVLLIGGGNPNLKPQTAKTWSTGFNWKPAAAKGLELSTNYYNIDYKDRISNTLGLSNQILVDPAYSALVLARGPVSQADYDKWINYLNANNIPPQTAGACTPLPSCLVGLIDSRIVNAGRLKTNGFDLTARYEFTNSLGAWTVAGNANRVLHWRVGITNDSTLVERLGLNSDAYPVKFRARGQLGWKNASWQVTGFVNYVGTYFNDTVPGSTDKVDPFTTIDLNTSYTFGNSPLLLKDLRVSLNVQNLLAKDPPFVRFLGSNNNNATFDPQNASAIGRQISFQLIKPW